MAKRHAAADADAEAERAPGRLTADGTLTYPAGALPARPQPLAKRMRGELGNRSIVPGIDPGPTRRARTRRWEAGLVARTIAACEAALIERPRAEDHALRAAPLASDPPRLRSALQLAQILAWPEWRKAVRSLRAESAAAGAGRGSADALHAALAAAVLTARARHPDLTWEQIAAGLREALRRVERQAAAEVGGA